MRVNPRTSLDAARRLVKLTHKRVQGRTQRIEQAPRHTREQKDKPLPPEPPTAPPNNGDER